MPAVLVASKMKSGLPKPVYNVQPILQPPSRGQEHGQGGPERGCSRLGPLKSPLSEGHIPSSRTARDRTAEPQIYTDWANHYLSMSGHKRLVKDLQQDVADGVLLAEIIQVVANEKIADIIDYPHSHSEMIENIDACLGFLAAKGVNIKGLCAEEIRSGNLKAILGLFFSLSRYKQQQQQQQQQAAVKQSNHKTTAPPTALPAGPTPRASSCPLHNPQQHVSSGPRISADVQSRCSPHSTGLQNKAQNKTTRLPGLSVRAVGAGAENRKSQRSDSNSRRSQSFNHWDKPRTPAESCSHCSDKLESSPVMGDQGPHSSPVHLPNCTTGATSSTSSGTKGWRSKSLSVKHTATSSTFSIKHSSITFEAPPKVIAQKSMLNKLKLVKSVPASRTSSSASLVDPHALVHSEHDGASVCPVLPHAHLGDQQPASPGGSSPKLALKSVVQRTLGRNVGPKVGPAKAAEMDKARPEGKDQDFRPSSGSDQEQGQDEKAIKETQDLAEVKKPTMIAKGPKSNKTAKKEGAFSSVSGIPKPAQLGKGSGVVKASVAPPCGRGRERSCRIRSGGGVLMHKCPIENKNSSASSSTLTEDKDSQNRNSSVSQSIANNAANNAANVQLPLPQLPYSHPNTATVAPFMYRSQTDMDTFGLMEEEDGMKESSDLHCKSMKTSLESLAGDDPESRRLRTVKNIADLRQNLEETMSSLRHTAHISHSTLETTFDNCVTTEINGRGLLTLSPRPASALPWRQGLSSPRLQAGDAPSLGSGYEQPLVHCPHRQTNLDPVDNLHYLGVSNKVEDLEGVTMETAGYLSDRDILGKSVRTDSTTSGWDDSSSVSSGISEILDTDDLSTSLSCRSYVTTPSGPRRNTEEQTDTEKHSAVAQNSLWNNNDLACPDGCSDGCVKMNTGSKWCHLSDISDKSECSLTGCKTPTISQTGSWRRGTSGQVGVACPQTKALMNCSSLKVHNNGKTDDAKVSEKGRTSPQPNRPPRSSSQRQASLTEGKKLPSGPTTRATPNALGSKKNGMVTAASATPGKMPMTAGFTTTRLIGRQTSVDDGYLPPSARTTLQYRSLPRPSRANRGAGAAHAATRPTTCGVDVGLISKGTATLPNPKSRRCLTVSANQTDREKGVLSDTGTLPAGLEDAGCGDTGCGDTLTRQDQHGKQAGGRYSDVSPPTLHRYAHFPQGRESEDARDWLRSHSAGGQVSGGVSPFSPSSTLSSPTGTRFNFTIIGSPTMAVPTNLAASRASSSLANQDGPHDPHSDHRPRNTSVSSDEKIRTMTASGSFREVLEEVHGSSLSLVSNTSSVYSTPDEKSHSEIRKLRRELESSQEKVSTLTTQLSANAHLVAAFEKSLGNMTIRLQSLTSTAEQKDTELNELRKTIDLLKNQNCVAQAAISGVLDTPAPPSKVYCSVPPQPVEELQIQGQRSSDSVSITSASSLSSVPSSLEHDAKNKKKRKNWLRTSFKQAFGKRSMPRSASSHSDVEDGADPSLSPSPTLQYGRSPPATGLLLRHSQSNSLPVLSSLSVYGHGWGSSHAPIRTSSLARISECMDSDADMVLQLRSDLRDKDMKLTDIRLEALSSAHQLDQLRESMSRMQMEIEKLKAENDRLRMDTRGSCSTFAAQGPLTPLEMGLPPQPNLTESTSLDMLLENSSDGSLWKEGPHVKVVVSVEREPNWKEESRPRHFLIGCIGVSGRTKWEVLDGVVRRLFKEYIIHVDPLTQLGLSTDSVLGYSIGDVLRTSHTDTPELLPCGYLVGDNDTISVRLKGVAENSQDTLAFETLIPKPVLQRCVSQLREHGRVILSGPSGTGKSFLASRLAEHLALLEGHTLADKVITTFNVDNKSRKEVKQYLSNLTDQGSSSRGGPPLVVVLDNLHHIGPLGDVFNGLLSCKHLRRPYIIGTMNQVTSSPPNLHLHHNFRWVLCANHTEPVKGFLGRFLRRKLLETEISNRARNCELVKIIEWMAGVWLHLNRFLETHSSSDVTIGPRLFLSCPMDVEGSQVWFTDLWNYSIIPYLLEAVREGLQLYGRKAAWEDPTRWVLESYPWPSVPPQLRWPPLLQLRPEDVGFDSYGPGRGTGPGGQAIQPSSEADPLMNMIMRLKEASHCTGPASYDSDSNSNSNQDDVLDPSLESTL
ncbi:neuron navigator 2 [Brachyhypopomus gauderio]|uniref:neuron navigator 2 n=1 Tax=Brachyhypopomus gauderio TaxID=698409 RepID=UPI0040428084